MSDLFHNSFTKEKGFGEYKNIAVELLKKTIKILEEFKIKYFLISGTLLGYVRHNDFIPWDDDMDLMVDKKIVELLPLIMKKYGDELYFYYCHSYTIKFCFKNQGIDINYDKVKKFCLNGNEYKFPFIDLFYFEKIEGKFIFFHKEWNYDDFFPVKKVLFNGITVTIPKNPHIFLVKNYGEDYMTKLVSSNYNHKEEKFNEKIYYIKTQYL
jgi:phosphorylcholine metabolism protein LicD